LLPSLKEKQEGAAKGFKKLHKEMRDIENFSIYKAKLSGRRCKGIRAQEASESNGYSDSGGILCIGGDG